LEGKINRNSFILSNFKNILCFLIKEYYLTVQRQSD
jgi:hypothetical protein